MDVVTNKASTAGTPSQSGLASQLQPSSQPGSKQWRDHIIVCGLQTLGFRVAEQLRAAGLEVVVIDDQPDPALVQQAQRLQIVLVQGDARDAATLTQTGLLKATALIACGKNDLYNLQIILAAHRLSQEVRIVANFSDPKLGLELNRAVANLSVLSLAQMAAPSFTESCLSSSVIDFFKLEQHQMVVVQARVTRPSSLERISAIALPLFLGQTSPRASNNKVASTSKCQEVNPFEVQTIEPGQYLTLAGRIEDLLRQPELELNEKEVLQTLARYKPHSPAQSQRPKLWRSGPRLASQAKAVLRQLASEVEGPFRYAVIVVGLIILVSTLLLWQFYRSSFTTAQGQPLDFTLLDALYFTITVVTSVGFGDYNFAQQDWGLKIFGIFLILVGVAATSVLYAFVANFIISRRLAQTLGQQQATELRNHVVVCGLGAVGHEVMQGLYKQGQPVVVVDHNEQGAFNQEARRLGVPLIYGDINQSQTLRAANVQQARAIALLTGDDLANLKAALSARAEFTSFHPNQQPPLRVVLRLFDLDLAEHIAETFDIQISYSTSGLAAPYFVGAALSYEILSTFYFQRQLFVVVRLEINRSSKLVNQTVQQFYEATRMSVIACSLPLQIQTTQAQELASSIQLYPSAQTRLVGGTVIYLVGSPYQMLKVYQLNQAFDL